MTRRNPTMVTPQRATRSSGSSTTVLTYSSFPKSKPGLTTASKKRKSPTNSEDEFAVSPTSKRVHLTTTSRLSHVSIPVRSEFIQRSHAPKPTHLLPPFFAFYTSLPLLPTSMPLVNLARHLRVEPKVVREMVVVSQKTCLKLSTSTGRGLGEMVYFPACNPLLLAKARAEVRGLVEAWEGEILGCENAPMMKLESTPVVVKKEEEDAMDVDMDEAPAVKEEPIEAKMQFDLNTRNRILQERIRNKIVLAAPSREDTVRAVAEQKAVHVTGVLTGMLLCAGGRRSFSVDEVVERVMGSVSGMGRKEVECALEILSAGRPLNGVAVKLVEARGVKAVVVRRV